jgi:hypothetical protein
MSAYDVRSRKIISASLYTFDEFVYERHAEQKLMVYYARAILLR